jgi:hypothetical protein
MHQGLGKGKSMKKKKPTSSGPSVMDEYAQALLKEGGETEK